MNIFWKTFLGALRSKVMWFNVITFVLALLALPEIVAIIPMGWLPTMIIVNSVGNFILRMMTNESLVGKGSK